MSEEKTFYIGKYQAYRHFCRENHLDLQRHIHITRPEQMLGLSRQNKIIRVGPIEGWFEIESKLRIMGYQAAEGKE